ncbi:hypothetical protein VNO80_23435 [Phaseolus coccineus]|uniref:Uncharacterized protein n=1 Tax=Phaseolus coccineus TaxID=3886 RepID=A0AAN9QSI6_PHACN
MMKRPGNLVRLQPLHSNPHATLSHYVSLNASPFLSLNSSFLLISRVSLGKVIALLLLICKRFSSVYSFSTSPPPLQRNSFRHFYRLSKTGLNELMESKGGKKKSSSSSKSLFYEAPLGYSIEDIRPNGGIKKFRSAAYSNCARKPS